MAARPSRGRRSAGSLVLLLLAILGLGLASCGDGRRDAASSPAPAPAPETRATETSSMPRPPSPGPSTLPTPGPPYAVGTLRRDFVDQSRGRTLKTLIHFPAAGPGSAIATPAPGSFPMVLMAHGYQLPADGYERVLTAVSAAGYITVAPDFPFTSGAVGNGNRSDIVNQPADLSFIIDRVGGLGVGPGGTGEIPVIADPSRVAVMGHSDGGLTATAIGYGNSYRDPRVAAVVSMTGGIALYGGSFFATDSPPLLAVHGRADETNPLSASTNLFARVPAGIPKFLVTVDGGSHLGPFMFDSARADVAQAIVDFLDGVLRGDGAGLDRLRVGANRDGLSLQEG